jgi:hypothetical protein
MSAATGPDMTLAIMTASAQKYRCLMLPSSLCSWGGRRACTASAAVQALPRTWIRAWFPGLL